MNARLATEKVVGPTILLFGGTYFDFLDPWGSEFTIEDIAHGLAHLCRFNGQCRRFYSVAQHSCHAHDVAPDSHKYVALMHDAPEAVIGDMTKPLKNIIPAFCKIEDDVENAMFSRFNVPDLDKVVKEIDKRMLVTEQHQLMNNLDGWSSTRGYDPYDFELPDWSPDRAKQEFLDRYHALHR